MNLDEVLRVAKDYLPFLIAAWAIARWLGAKLSTSIGKLEKLQDDVSTVMGDVKRINGSIGRHLTEHSERGGFNDRLAGTEGWIEGRAGIPPRRRGQAKE